MKRSETTSPSCPGLLLSVVLALWAGMATGQSSDWFLLEFADSRPPCADVAADQRCVGTQPRIAHFEMRDGERIEMQSGSDAPPVWTAFGGVWVYATQTVQDYQNTAIELTATPTGARLIISDRGRHYLQSVPLERWVALESDVDPTLWVRVTPH
ncbi:MAG: hypothetical protein AB7I04_06200 [Pseudomonadales bacterium]